MNPVNLTEEELSARLNGVEHLLCNGQAKWLHDQVFQLPELSNVLEIGTYHGHSAAAMALACLDAQKYIYVVDANPDYLAIATKHWRRLKFGGIIKPFTAASRTLLTMSTLWHWPKFDFVFIDASHLYADVLFDYEQVKQIVSPGARIAFHDVCEGWPEVAQVWNEIAAKELKDHLFCETIASGILT